MVYIRRAFLLLPQYLVRDWLFLQGCIRPRKRQQAEDLVQLQRGLDIKIPEKRIGHNQTKYKTRTLNLCITNRSIQLVISYIDMHLYEHFMK